MVDYFKLFKFYRKQYFFFGWLICCILFFTLVDLYWQFIILANIAVIGGICSVICRISYLRNNKALNLLSGSQNPNSKLQIHVNRLAFITHLLLVVTVITGISAILLAYVQWLSIPSSQVASSKVMPIEPYSITLASFKQLQKIRTEITHNQFALRQAPMPTSYTILARPTVVTSPVPTYTPIPSQISGMEREFALSRLLPGIVIAHVNISNNLLVPLNGYILLINNSIKTDISGWRLVDETHLLCIFKDGWIEQNSITKVRRGKGDATKQDIYCDCDVNLWKTEHRILILKDASGNIVDQWINLDYSIVEEK